MRIEIRLKGAEGLAASGEAEAVLRAAAGAEPECQERRTDGEPDRGDPVAIAALVLSVPGAILSALDLAQRARLAERVRALLARLRASGGAATLHVPGEPPLDLASATGDDVMDRLARGGPGTEAGTATGGGVPGTDPAERR